MKPGGIEPWCRAEKETSLKEEIQARAALLDFTVLLAVGPGGRQDAPVDLLQECKLCYTIHPCQSLQRGVS